MIFGGKVGEDAWLNRFEFLLTQIFQMRTGRRVEYEVVIVVCCVVILVSFLHISLSHMSRVCF